MKDKVWEGRGIFWEKDRVIASLMGSEGTQKYRERRRFFWIARLKGAAGKLGNA